MGRPRRQKPYPRIYADGRRVWVARYYDLDGKAHYAKPRWNGGKSSFAREGDAQRAIDEALALLCGTAEAPRKLGDYSEYWLEEHPRSTRTDKTNSDRLSYVLDTLVEGRPLREWEFDELRRRHALKLVDHMFRIEGRAAKAPAGCSACSRRWPRTRSATTRRPPTPSSGSSCEPTTPGSKSPRGSPEVWSFEQIDWCLSTGPHRRDLGT